MTNRTLKAAVVGVGHFGRHHARIYGELPDVDLVAVVDIDGERAEQIAAKTGAKPLTDYHEILDTVELVSVATPTESHFSIARDFLNAGVGVLVEKPMAATFVQARELVEAAQAGKVTLQVGYVNRYSSLMRTVDELDVKPGFIEVHRLSAFNFRAADLGVVLDMMIHDIDVVLSLVDDEVTDVRAVGLAIIGKNEDIANARITFANGCVANLTASRLSLKPMRKVRVFCHDSYVSLDFDRNHALVVRKAPGFSPGSFETEQLKTTQPDEFKTFVLSNLCTVKEFTFDNEVEPLRLQLEAFVECVRTGSEPTVSGAKALKTMHVAELILDAIRPS